MLLKQEAIRAAFDLVSPIYSWRGGRAIFIFSGPQDLARDTETEVLGV